MVEEVDEEVQGGGRLFNPVGGVEELEDPRCEVVVQPFMGDYLCQDGDGVGRREGGVVWFFLG